jgi:cytochrome P450
MDESSIEKPTLGRPKDLLSLLVRANTLASSADRLDDKEVLAQIPTFLGAGHETTSTLLSWILLCLAQNPAVQEKLRAECMSSTLPTSSRGNEPLSSEELSKIDKLEWLDAIVHETLRLHSPVTLMARIASLDDEIPLSRPYVDRSGVMRDTISIKKGDNVMLPLSLVNCTESIWGPDAGQWRPERWMRSLPEEATKVPGVWGNVLSFSAGPHGCIGYKFSLYEYVCLILPLLLMMLIVCIRAKVILHALICRYAFHLSDGPEEVVPLSGLVVRPAVKGQEEEGARLMLRLSRVEV